jgi:3-oxoacyl-[acyl-carrier-protein] synthase II
VDLAPNQARRREVKVAVNNSFGFGGTNASVVFGRPQPAA